MTILIHNTEDVRQSQGWVMSTQLLVEMATNEFKQGGDKRLGMEYLQRAQETLSLLEDMNDRYLGTGAYAPKEAQA